MVEGADRTLGPVRDPADFAYPGSIRVRHLFSTSSGLLLNSPGPVPVQVRCLKVESSPGSDPARIPGPVGS